MSKIVNDKSSQVNFINKNNQKIFAVNKLEKSSHGQLSYQIECLNCACLYSASNADLFQKKCLHCQSGSFTFP